MPIQTFDISPVGRVEGATPIHSRAKRMTEDSVAAVRAHIGKTLAGEHAFDSAPIPKTDRDFSRIRSALRALPQDDIGRKVAIAGLKDHPRGAEDGSCRECIYFLSHYQWCGMPELRLPVQPGWHCLLCCI